MYGKGFTSLRSNRKQNHLAMHLCQNLTGLPWLSPTSAQSENTWQCPAAGHSGVAVLGEPLPWWEECLFLKLFVYMKTFNMSNIPARGMVPGI